MFRRIVTENAVSQGFCSIVETLQRIIPEKIYNCVILPDLIEL